MAYQYDYDGHRIHSHDDGSSPERYREHRRRPARSARSREQSPDAAHRHSSSHAHSRSQASNSYAHSHASSSSSSSNPRAPLKRQQNPPSSQAQQIPSRPKPNISRQRWPPRPKVEDAARAEKYIYGAPYESDYDPPNRGTVDQEPLLIQVLSQAPKVLPAVDTPKPKASRDTVAKRPARPKAERQANPTASDVSSSSTADSGHYTSHKDRSRKNSREQSMAESWLEESRRKIGTLDTKDVGRSASGTTTAVPTAGDDDKSFSSQGSRAPAKYAGVGAGTRESVLPGIIMSASSSSRSSDFGLAERPSSRRNTESISTPAGRPRFDDSPRDFIPSKRDAPPPASRVYAPDPLQTGGYTSGRRVTPPASVAQGPSATSSPPDSPGHHGRDRTPPRSGRSSPSTRSRPSSPISGQSIRFDDGLRRASTFPVVLEDRTQKTSSLATSSMSIDQVDTPVTSPQRSNLPYPTDDMLIMPSAADFAYKPRNLQDLLVPRLYGDDNSLDRDSRSSPTESHRPSRPGPESRHTFDGERDSPHSPRHATFDQRAPPRPPKSSHSACLVSPGKQDFQDWYCVPDTSVLNICPFCAETRILNSVYASKIERRDRQHHDPSFRCCFTSKWLLLAWQLTQAERAEDLSLLASIARMDRDARLDHHAQPCPGDVPHAGKWMVLRHHRSTGEKPIPFYVCPLDVRKIGKLLPELKHEFDEYHTRHRESCALHEASHRFEKYTDKLVVADAEAHRKKRKPDLAAFVQLARVLSEVNPCTRDAFVRDARWHYSSQAPSLTVCPECYTTIVWPEAHAGSSVAKRIADTDLTVDREHHLGLTCQLWSRRMLAVFAKAVRNNDFKYLAEEAEDRASMERTLRKEWLELDRRAAELERVGSAGDGQGGRDAKAFDLQRARHQLADEWRRYE